MSNAISIALSAQAALRRQLDVVANNVANSSTPAFKGQRMVFSQWLLDDPKTAPISFVQDWGTARDTRQGGMTQTGNSLDLALEGEGYFAIQTPEGVRYTRNGRFQLDAGGQLVTASGYAVLGEGDAPIVLPANAGEIGVAHDGTVTTEEGAAGQIQVVAFERESALRAAADGTYVTDAPPLAAVATKVRQGMVEESNVQPILEMSRMMEVSHRYNAAKEMAETEHERIKTAIDKLARSA
jgi:flagellar basal-body rod protein FlgF